MVDGWERGISISGNRFQYSLVFVPFIFPLSFLPSYLHPLPQGAVCKIFTFPCDKRADTCL